MSSCDKIENEAGYLSPYAIADRRSKFFADFRKIKKPSLSYDTSGLLIPTDLLLLFENILETYFEMTSQNTI